MDDGVEPEAVISRSGAAAGTPELLPLLGRTLLVVGGAFVLRAVTEAGLLGPALGSALAIVYAVAWLVMADRSAAKGATVSATWYGIAGTIIAYPLLWETTVEFHFLTPTAAAAALGLITAIGLGVGWLRRLLALSSIVSIATVVTLLALAVATKLPVLFASWMLAAGLATLWIGYSRGWPGLVWIVAVPADLMVALLTAVLLIADTERAAELLRPGSVIALQLALVIVYIGSFVIRTLVARAEVQALEIIQGLAVVTIGLGGAIAVARTNPWAWLPLGLVAAVVGAAGYTASFTLIDRSVRRTNFIFYSSLAMVFALVAATALLTLDVLVIVLAIGAVLMAWSGSRLERATLSLHGAVYASGAAIASGLLTESASMLTDRGLVSAGWIGPAVLVALIGSVAYCAFKVAGHGRTWGQLSTLPKFLVITIAVFGSAGVCVAAISELLPHRDGVILPSALAVLRTAVLAVGAVALAWLGRYPRVMQATWLVYPVLIVGGIKLLIEDLRVGEPAILVASFALYGGALILAPRLRRKSGRRDDAQGQGETRSDPDESSPNGPPPPQPMS